MFLSGLRIENFRAIRKAVIHFDDSTALIGENDCGISSVLDALDLALGTGQRRDAYPPWLFHHDRATGGPSGPIRLQLRFREQEQNDWSGAAFQPFSELLEVQDRPLREIWYEIHIGLGTGDARARFRLRVPGSKARTSDKRLIGRFREMNPVIRVRPGTLTGHGATRQTSAHLDMEADNITDEVASLVRRIQKAVDARMSGTSTDLKADLADGFDAAFELVRGTTFRLGKWESGLSRSVAEIMGWNPEVLQNNHAPDLRHPHSEPERLGVLLLIGALLRARPGGMAPDADPTWILEEPEAHLHPITLASMANLLGLIQRQKVLTTYSPDLLSVAPLSKVRRLVRFDGELHERRVRSNLLSRSEMRRFHHHFRSRFGVALFARQWLLVEGESEVWILSQLARLLGYDLALEGIAVVEFAQCGLEGPIKVARGLGIQWHLLSDGDEAGRRYAGIAMGLLGEDERDERITVLPDRDIERFLWKSGYEGVFRRHAKLSDKQSGRLSPGKVIQAAVRKRSKPALALAVIEAMAEEGSPGVPVLLSELIESCVRLARDSAARLSG